MEQNLSSFYGSIDLTRLGQIVRQHPELVKVANMKDGTQHKFLNIDISPKQQGADQYGNVAYLKAACKKAEQKQGLNYYLADLRLSQNSQQQQAAPPQQAPIPSGNDDLPF
jgi:hypothetical protein